MEIILETARIDTTLCYDNFRPFNVCFSQQSMIFLSNQNIGNAKLNRSFKDYKNNCLIFDTTFNIRQPLDLMTGQKNWNCYFGVTGWIGLNPTLRVKKRVESGWSLGVENSGQGVGRVYLAALLWKRHLTWPERILRSKSNKQRTLQCILISRTH